MALDHGTQQGRNGKLGQLDLEEFIVNIIEKEKQNKKEELRELVVKIN